METAHSNCKRICMISPHGYLEANPKPGQIDTGGQVIFIVQIAKALARQGLLVDIYTRCFDGNHEQETIEENVRIIRLKAGTNEFVRKEDIGPFLPMFSKELVRYIQNNKLQYQVLHAHYWDGGVVGIHAAEALQLPLIYTSHSLGAWKRELIDFEDMDLDQLFRFKERIAAEHKIFGFARHITAASSTEVELIRRFYGIGSEKIDIVPPGVDIEKFYYNDFNNSPYEQPYIFTTGRHAWNKGFKHLLQAYASIVEHTNALVVIGGGSQNPQGEEIQVRNKLNELIDQLQLHERVRITGYLEVDELVRHYQNAQLFTLCSDYEPFGLVSLEAMACGTPVVVSSLGGIRDILRDGENALLVEPSDHQALATSFMKILESDDYGHLLGQAGLQLVTDEFTWTHVSGLLRNTYEKACH